MSGFAPCKVATKLFWLVCTYIACCPFYSTWQAKVYELVSVTISYRDIITYLLSIFWVFDERRMKNTLFEVLIFVAIGIVGLGLMNFFMWIFTDQMAIPNDFVCNLLSTALVTLWNFIAKKYILFTKNEKN